MFSAFAIETINLHFLQGDLSCQQPLGGPDCHEVDPAFLWVPATKQVTTYFKYTNNTIFTYLKNGLTSQITKFSKLLK